VAPPRPGSGASSADASSWVAGGHAGYNWQQGAAVFGFATDLQATRLNTSTTALLSYAPGPGAILPTDTAFTSSSIDWYGTLRGQLGIANGPWLLYGPAGLAYGNLSLSSLYRTGGLTLNPQASEVKAGWTAGAGVKYRVLPNVSVGLQYLYVDLGGLGLAASASLGPNTIALRSDTSGQFHTVTAGVSWHFTPTNAAMPWQGGYAGIHGGGDWGNSTNAVYTGSQVFLSDVRLKHDITLVGRRSDGLGVYGYKYLWSDAVYVGVLAQEVALIHPGAIVRDDLTGYLSVDYGQLNGR
jgi:outer membrane immunogenic protein